MIRQKNTVIWVACSIFAAVASGDPLTYVIGAAGISNQGQFGTLDVTTGAFQQIGPNTPFGSFGLAGGPNGSLLTLAYSGDLYSINPATGASTFVGKTGLTDCTSPGVSPCGPTSAFDLTSAGGKIYATDFHNNLYTINPSTGAATLLNANTGLPPSPFDLGTLNPDGTINFADEAIWSAGGTLYATFDALTFDLNTNQPVNVLVAPQLYQIDPSTGKATVIGSTDLGIGGVADVNGTNYAFNDATNQVCTLSLATGNTSQCAAFDPAAGVIQGAAPVPEPASFVLAGMGILAFFANIRRKRIA